MSKQASGMRFTTKNALLFVAIAWDVISFSLVLAQPIVVLSLLCVGKAVLTGISIIATSRKCNSFDTEARDAITARRRHNPQARQDTYDKASEFFTKYKRLLISTLLLSVASLAPACWLIIQTDAQENTIINSTTSGLLGGAITLYGVTTFLAYGMHTFLHHRLHVKLAEVKADRSDTLQKDILLRDGLRAQVEQFEKDVAALEVDKQFLEDKILILKADQVIQAVEAQVLFRSRAQSISNLEQNNFILEQDNARLKREVEALKEQITKICLQKDDKFLQLMTNNQELCLKNALLYLEMNQCAKDDFFRYQQYARDIKMLQTERDAAYKQVDMLKRAQRKFQHAYTPQHSSRVSTVMLEGFPTPVPSPNLENSMRLSPVSDASSQRFQRSTPDMRSQSEGQSK